MLYTRLYSTSIVYQCFAALLVKCGGRSSSLLGLFIQCHQHCSHTLREIPSVPGSHVSLLLLQTSPANHAVLPNFPSLPKIVLQPSSNHASNLDYHTTMNLVAMHEKLLLLGQSSGLDIDFLMPLFPQDPTSSKKIIRRHTFLYWFSCRNVASIQTKGNLFLLASIYRP